MDLAVRMTQGYQQRLLKHFYDNVLLKHVGLIRVLPLAVHLIFYAEQVEGVILNHFCSLGFIMLKSYGGGPYNFRESPEYKFLFPSSI